jgi:hypothetical protein
VFKVHRLRILLACCVAVAAGVGVATQAIGASTPTGTAEVSTATDPFAAYHPESGPLLSDASLEEVATTEAARAENASPASVSATNASYAQAAQAVDPQSIPNTKPSSAGQARYMEAPAVVITMTGHFTLTTAHVPNNAQAPSGPVMFLVLDARTGRVEMRGIKEEVPAQVAALGSARALSAGGNS